MALSATAGITFTIAAHATMLLTITSIAVIAKVYADVKDLDMKANACKSSYELYENLINDIKSIVRGSHYNKLELIHRMKLVDDQVCSIAPVITERIEKSYNDRFTI